MYTKRVCTKKWTSVNYVLYMFLDYNDTKTTDIDNDNKSNVCNLFAISTQILRKLRYV